ncbi:MAG: DUF1015 domain-containing protein [Lachnospiraceae bacterium]|jgi:uncharacterized protein (DUF1015 family)|nr:DUF1015 domain-containing protein [Lachnospiraceae bacterium]
MAVIKPFCAIRPDRAKADKIAALPYDVYNREEAKAEVKKHPESFLKIDRAETQLADTVDTYDPQVYQKAHDTLWEMVENGSFVREEKRCYYIYTLTMNGRTQTGITACASIDDYESGVIKKHENTRAEKEQDRINHVNICNAQTGPIFLAYRSNPVINQVVEQVQNEEPLYDFTAKDQVRHTVWVISEEAQIAAVEEAFAGIGEIYIADGHHRAASAVRVGQMRRTEHPEYTGEEEFNYFLSVLFPDEQLMIMDYNRVVKDLNGWTEEEFLVKVSEIFAVEELGKDPVKPEQKGCFSMYLKGTWYRCAIAPKDQTDDPVEGLDVSVLQKKLLAPVLGIQDPKTDSRIDFVGGIRGLKELERRCSLDCKAAFAMYPTSIQELFAVADAGLLMPPKSTWFEPKLRSGLFIHELER